VPVHVNWQAAPCASYPCPLISPAGVAAGDQLIVNQPGNSDGSSKLFALTPSPNPCPAGGRPLAARQDVGAAAFDFKAAGFDFAFFLFVSHPRNPFTPPLIRMSHLAVFPTL
jgi:hypothetical protein